MDNFQDPDLFLIRLNQTGINALKRIVKIGRVILIVLIVSTVLHIGYAVAEFVIYRKYVY